MFTKWRPLCALVEGSKKIRFFGGNVKSEIFGSTERNLRLHILHRVFDFPPLQRNPNITGGRVY